MADQNELTALRERIGRLSGGEQTWLLEAVLADKRRRWTEEAARQRAADAAFREAMKQEIAAVEQWHTEQQRQGLAEEAKREAG